MAVTPPAATTNDKPAPDLADVPYGLHERHRIDFWKARADKPAPIVVFFHGGGFYRGDKNLLPPNILSMCQDAGFAVAAVNYRLSVEVTYPAYMLDSARAVQFIRSQAGQWNIDASRVAACGGSAGAGISLWLGFHDDLARPDSPDVVARQSSRLTCMGLRNAQCSYDPHFYRQAGLAPANNHPFMPLFYGRPVSQMGTPQARRMATEAAGITYFHAGGPPVFLYYSSPDDPLPYDDTPVGPKSDETDMYDADPVSSRAVHHPEMGRIMKRRLDELRVECELHVNVADRVAQVEADMVEFFKRHLLS